MIVAMLTPPEAAKMLRVSPRRIRAEIMAGRLRAINLGDHRRPSWRIDPGDLRAYLATMATAPQRRVSTDSQASRPRKNKWDL
jgi:excisionase family DNA binding protein